MLKHVLFIIALLTLTTGPALAAPGVSPGPVPILSAADLPGFSTPASLAGASTLGVTVGAQAWVINQGIWSYQPTCACVSDGSTCVASTPTPAACWGRSTAGYSGANTQTTWFVNPSTGSDSASGLTSGAALKTDQERQRRTAASPVTVSVSVTLLGSANVGDFLMPPLMGPGGYIAFTGSAGVTVLRSSTLTAAAAQSGNNTGTVTDSTLPVSWTASGLVGKRFRRVSDSAVTWIAIDKGTKVAAVSDVQTYVTMYPPTYNANRVALAAGNAYVIEQLPLWPVAFENSASPVVPVGGAGGNYAVMSFEGIEFTGPTGNQCTTVVPPLGTPFAPGVTFYGCCLSAMSGSIGAWVSQWDDLFGPDAGSAMYLDGCLISTGDNYVSPGVDVAVTDATLVVGTLDVLGQLIVFGDGGLGVTGAVDGLSVQPGGQVVSGSPFYGAGGGVLWGTGNSGRGARVFPQGMISYGIAPTITGTLGDAIIGADAKTWAGITPNGGYVSASLASVLINTGAVTNTQPLTSAQVTTALGFTPASSTTNLRSFSWGANASLVNAAAQNIPPGSQTAAILADAVLGIQTGPGGGTLTSLFLQFTGSASNIAGQTVTFTLTKTTLGGTTTTMTVSSAIATTSGIHRLTVSAFTVSGVYAAGDVLTLQMTPSALLTAALTDVMAGAG
jgi:hypothetical protein